MYIIHPFGAFPLLCLWRTDEVAKFSECQNQSVSNAFMYICLLYWRVCISPANGLTNANLAFFPLYHKFYCSIICWYLLFELSLPHEYWIWQGISAWLVFQRQDKWQEAPLSAGSGTKLSEGCCCSCQCQVYRGFVCF